ncbi:MAG: hypothetical protein OCD76_24425, partial [Reichenbachiella sp.]
MKFIQVKKWVFSFILIVGFSQTAFSQSFSAGVNVDSPNPNAVLHLVSPNGNQGVLVPNLTTNQRTAMNLASVDNGMLVYDGTDGHFYYWINPGWVALIVDLTSFTSDDLVSGVTNLYISAAEQALISTAVQNELDPTVPANIKDGIDWTELTGVPADILDGDDTGGASTDLSSFTADDLAEGSSNLYYTDARVNTLIGTTNIDVDDSDDLTTADVGTGPNNIVELDASSRLPAVDGSLLTGISATGFSGTLTGDVTGTQGSTTVDNVGGETAANIALATGIVNGATSLDLDDSDDLTTADVGTGPNNIVELDAS